MEDYEQVEATEGGREEALRRIGAPATGLLVVAILSLCWSAYSLVGVLTGDAREQQAAELEKQREEFIKQNGEESVQFFDSMVSWIEALSHPGIAIVSILITALIAFGAFKMRKLESPGLAKIAAILAVIPCLSPGCCFGIPFGIWALVVMGKDEVSSHFS
jgi:hypothetical protein